MMRIGHGMDVHQLAEGHPFVLGGVKIPFHKGAVGHSDADVLIHAVCDALLGAAALRDIGFHFPDSSDEFLNIDSRLLLQSVVELLAKHHYRIGNVDCTIALQEPKISKYIPEMQETLASLMHIDLNCMSIKATTTEHLGFTGRGEGIAVWAVALLYDDHQVEV